MGLNRRDILDILDMIVSMFSHMPKERQNSMKTSNIQFKKFEFKNYKGIKGPLVVEFDSTRELPYCLIGDNEAGKTTILQGIETIGKLCQGKMLENGDRLAIKPIGSSFSGDVELGAIYVDSSSPEEEKEIKFVYRFKESKFTNLYVNGETGKAKINKHLLKLRNSPEFLYYDDFEIEIPKVVDFSENAQLENPKMNRLWVSFFNDIVQVANDTKSSFREFVLDWDEDDAPTIQNRLAEMEACLSDKVGHEWYRITGRDQWFEGFSIERDRNNKEQFHLYVKEGRIKYPLYSRSKGFRWFLCFVLISVFRSAAGGKSTIFLLDEPASNVHIAKQEPILESLIAVAKQEGTGLIYSTHAPGLIDTERTEPLYCVGRENENKETSEVSIHLVEGEISLDSANGFAFILSISQRKMFKEIGKVSRKVSVEMLGNLGSQLKDTLGEFMNGSLSDWLKNI